MSRPGRQRMELDDEYMAEEITCPRCPRRFKHIFDLDRHLEINHGLTHETREIIYINMGIKWFQNYTPPGRWEGWWID